ncbi:17985_t:CDS:2, partial [Racocetra fulgida]
ALCKQAKRPEEAAQHYLCCIKKNPYMWEAFEKKKRSRIANDERILIGLDEEKKWSKVPREEKTTTNVENEVAEALQKTTLSPQINLELDKIDDTDLKSDNNEFLHLLKQLAKGYGYLSQYECAKAIEAFSELPPSQNNTAWVQSHTAKAHFEMVNYPVKARQLEPYRLEDMELYSTTLWHLRKDTALSALAHELIEFERRSPQTWCAVGNCFSRQQEHDVALKCFRRAIQLDQSFTYAHTLSGHEKKLQDGDENQPKSCSSYVLLGEVEEARALYDRACQVTPQTPLAIFKKAKSLYRDKQYKDALEELEKLKKTVPNEPKVYFLMAKIHKAMGERTKATQNFTLALNLDPKMMHIVKNAIEQCC